MNVPAVAAASLEYRQLGPFNQSGDPLARSSHLNQDPSHPQPQLSPTHHTPNPHLTLLPVPTTHLAFTSGSVDLYPAGGRSRAVSVTDNPHRQHPYNQHPTLSAAHLSSSVRRRTLSLNHGQSDSINTPPHPSQTASDQQSRMNAYTPPASSAVLANKSSNNSVTANAAESKRLNYSAEVRSILLLWLGQNREYPYPSDAVKNDLAVKTGLTLQQVNNWFINARRRKYQFMLEDVPTGSPGSSTSISTPPVHPVPQHTPPAQDTLIVTTPRLTSTGSTPSNSFSSHASSSSSHLRASFSSTMQSPSISSDTDRRMSAAGFGPGRRRAFSGNAAAAMSGTPPSHSPYWKTAAESLALQQQHQPTPQYPPSGSDHTVRSLGSFSNSSNLTSGENSSSKISPPVIIARGPSPLSGIDRPTRDLFLRQQQQQQQLSNQSAGLGRHQQMLHHQPYKLPAYNLSSYSVGNSSKSVTTAASVQPSPFAGNRTGTQLVVRPYILGAGNSSGHESTQQNKLVLPFPSPPFQQQQQQQKQPQQQQHATHRHSISLPQPVTYTSGANTREGDGFSVGSVVVNTLTMAGEGSAELAPLRPLFSQNKDGYNLEAQEKLRLEGRPRLESMFAKLSTDRSEAMNRLKGSEVSNLEGPLTDAMQVDEANVHKKREVYGVGGYEVSRGCLMEGERAVAEASMRMKERDAIWGICNDD